MPPVHRSSLRLPVLCLLFLAACTGANRGRSGPPLKQSATLYNQHLRWGVPMVSVEYVASEAREDFIKAVQDSAGHVKVLEVEIQAVRVGPKNDTADIFVSFLWTPGDSITTVSAVQRQTWKRVDRNWQILRAEPMADGPTIFTW